MFVVFKVAGYALLGWFLYQPLKGIVRVFRRRQTLKHIGETYPVETMRAPAQQVIGGSSAVRRRPAAYYRVTVDGFQVEIHPGMRTMTYPWTWTTLEIRLGYGLPTNLGVEATQERPFLQHILPGAQVSSADTEFDRVHHIKGDQPELASYLSESRRRALSALTRVGGSVKGSTLSNSYKLAIFSGEQLMKAISELVSVARVLVVPASETSPIPGLVANAGSDDIVSVRQQNLRFLYQYYGQSEEAAELTERLMNDAEPEIRLQAACHRPEGSEEVLLEFLRGDHPLYLQAQAVRGLSGCDPEKVKESVLNLLASTEVVLRLASIYAAGELKLAEAYEPMMTRFRATEGEEREALVKALVQLSDIGDAELEERLLETLREPPICAPGPIIHGLAAIGSVKSVEKLLKALAGAYGGSRSDRHAAKGAIMTIQGRAEGAASGQISLAQLDDTDGALSLESSAESDE